MSQTLHIKNMVCDRCIEAVTEELERSQLTVQSVQLGQAVVEHASDEQLETLQNGLLARGFELLKDGEDQIVSSLKTLIITSIQKPSLLQNSNYSDFLEKQIGKDYTTLSRLFSRKTGTTIEKFIIRQRIERVKELLSYRELSISEISNTLGYSSVQHLSTQFKKIEGVTPSQYLKNMTSDRKALDQL